MVQEKKEEVLVNQKRKILFLATYPSKEKGNPAFMDTLIDSKQYVILHPLYSYDTKVGKEALNQLPNKNVPMGKTPVDTIMRQDFYGISQSDLLIYDLDVDPGIQYLTAAILKGIPVICVSNVLASVYEYFSGAVEATVKPENLKSYIDYFFSDPMTAPVNPITKDKIKEVLDKHLGKEV